MPPPGMWKGCGRGIFGLNSWDPLRRPNQSQGPTAAPQRAPPGLNGNPGLNGQSVSPPRFERNASRSSATDARNVGRSSHVGAGGDNNNSLVNEAPRRKPASGVTLLAKYSYKANPESPIGRELNMKQGDHLALVSDEDATWWTAANRDGETGYVPASYVMKMAAKPTGLPWLQNRQEEESQNTEYVGKAKPYQSAYAKDGPNKRQYYCEICDKQLNGPQPYGAHMTSKAHKEEVEYRNSCQ